MFRSLFLCCTFFLVAGNAFAQPVDVSALQPDQPFDNIFSKQLYSDSLTTTFVIWIKERVPLHKHAAHTEQVHIVEGSGEMVLGDSTFTVHAGMHVFIPLGTPHSVRVTSATPLKVISIQTPMFDGTDRIKLE